MGGEFGGEWIHVYVWLSPFAVTETITTLFFVNQLCAVLCLVTQSCLTVAHGLRFCRLLCPWGFSRQEYWSGLLCPPPGHLPDPGMQPRSPALQVDTLPSEPPGKPRSTRVGSLSLLQGIFPSQELNWGLLHCRWILYQLSYQNSPLISYESESPIQLFATPPTIQSMEFSRPKYWGGGGVAFPFSRGSSQPRDRTQVSHNSGGFFTS